MKEKSFDLQITLLLLRRKKRRNKRVLTALGRITAVLVIFQYLIGLAVVEGNSMRPALFSGDVIVYSKWGGREVTYGDVVIVPYTNEEGVRKKLIKRIAALPGDEIAVDEKGYITRNGEEMKEKEIIFGYQEPDAWMEFPVIVPRDAYFYLGDNRPVSIDSRDGSVGFVRREEIIGKLLVVLRMPFGRKENWRR